MEPSLLHFPNNCACVARIIMHTNTHNVYPDKTTYFQGSLCCFGGIPYTAHGTGPRIKKKVILLYVPLLIL